jgi:hypothetical protein
MIRVSAYPTGIEASPEELPWPAPAAACFACAAHVAMEQRSEVTPRGGLALATELVPARQARAELANLDRSALGSTRTPAGPGPRHLVHRDQRVMLLPAPREQPGPGAEHDQRVIGLAQRPQHR